MGTKRPGCSVFDTLSNMTTADHKLHSGGKISRDPSPRPGMTAPSERDGNREEEWRRERETEKARHKARYRDTHPRERYYERDRDPPPRPRESEREWREKERRRDDDRGRNGRPLSNLEKEAEKMIDKGMSKGGTFPRMRPSHEHHNRKPMFGPDEERYGTQRAGPRRTEADERERERAWQREQRYREREKDDPRGKTKEDEKSRNREGYREPDAVFRDKRRDFEGADPRDRRDRDAPQRKGEKPRPGMGERRASPHRRRDRDGDRREREQAYRKGVGRDTRSEGDSDERELRRERMRDREREETMYQHSRSEGDGKDASERDRHRDRRGHRDREGDGRRTGSTERRRGGERDMQRYDRRPDREGERWRDDRRCDRREYEQRKGRERKEREADPRWDDSAGASSRSQREAPPRAPPRAQSSGEWSSDMDSETRYRRGRDSYEESGRDSEQERRSPEGGRREQKRSEKPHRGEMTGGLPEQRRMWLEPLRGKNSKESSLEEELVDRERQDTYRDGRREEERGMEQGRRAKEEPDERYISERRVQRGSEGRSRDERRERREDRGRGERESEGASAEGEEVGEVWRESDKQGKEHLSGSDEGTEGSWRRDAEGESTTDNTEESDREDHGGSDRWGRSESEGGSDTGWRQERDRMLSGEDGFVTVSSGGDEEDEREDEFVDCQDFWVGGNTCAAGLLRVREVDEGKVGERDRDKSVDEDEEGSEKQPKYVFCVIGQTLPRSKPNNVVDQGEVDHLNLERQPDGSDVTLKPQDDLNLSRSDKHLNDGGCDTRVETEQPVTGESSKAERASSELQDTDMREKEKKENPYAEIGSFQRDSQTERLLVQWREAMKDIPDSEQHSAGQHNPYTDVCPQVNLDQILPELDIQAMSPEEKEAIRIRLSGAWSMSEEPKRHSQAPHLKWAKDVVREILGRSEEKTVDESGDAEGDREGAATEPATGEVPPCKVDGQPQEPELEEEEEEEEEEELLVEVEGLRGTGQKQIDMHADRVKAMHADTPTHTHADTPQGKGRREDPSPAADKSQMKAEVAPVNVTEEPADEGAITEMAKEASRQKEVEMYLSVSNTLYKPNSCPILNYDSDLQGDSAEIKGQEQEENGGNTDSEGEEDSSSGTSEEVGTVNSEGVEADTGGRVTGTGRTAATLTSSCSFRDLGPEARIRRRGIRKTTERRKEEIVEEEEDGGVGRDRRTRIFSTTDDEDDRSKSWGEVELRNVLETIGRRKRNSRFFNAAQLYQQYSEAAQNFEILRQSRSDVLSVCEDTGPGASPAPSPPPARRPLPPLPAVPHPHSLSHTPSITSVKSLPLPEPPKSERRPSSPRLSISLSQTSTLWRELPAVRNSTELEELTEDQRRLQEVRFEVLTSEASYCRSLDIVVEHFVKSKQLASLLTTQDQNWLFSRLADVRAISHSFLSKLEERLESDIMHFTVCDVIARHCQRFKMVYVPYLTNQSYQDATYQRLMDQNPGFRRIVEKLEKSPVCQRLPLRSFLVLPFQRITRIKLLVQNIVKRTTPGTAEATQAIKALKLLEKLIQESNDSITQMKSIESLVSLSAKVDFECRTLPLISQSRRLVREGPVTELIDFSIKDTERNVYLHLFNDYLLLSQQKEGGRFTVIDHAPVSELRAENCRFKLHSLQKNLFRLHMSKHSLLLRTETQSDKLRWISALSRPHPEIDFSCAQDFEQMQCIRAFVAQQPDELSLEKADIILVHQKSSDHWVEGTRLSDRHRGWLPASHLETISNARVRQRNLSDALKLTTATATA